MNIPKIIDFCNLTDVLIFGSDTGEYEEMEKQSDDEWDNYTQILAKRGITICYSVQANKYVVYPS